MNIKFLIRDLKTEGVQVVTIRLAQLLKNHAHDVEIITLYDDVELENLGDLNITCLSIPESSRSQTELQAHFQQWYQNAEFDYLIAPHSECIKIISNISDSRLIPFIHNSDEHSYNQRNIFKRFKYRYKLRNKLKDKHVLCVSDSIQKFTQRCCGSKILSANVLYNPFDMEAIRTLSEVYNFSALQNEYLLFVGRLEKQKRVDRLLNAFSLIQNKSIKLLILGEGSLENELKRQAELLGISERVIFRKFETNPYPIIKAAKGLILTSDHEGLPTVIIEALILGVPALSVNCPSGPDEILTGTLSRYLINSYDEKVIADYIDSLLDESSLPDLSSGYEKFTEEKVYQSLMDIISTWESTNNHIG